MVTEREKQVVLEEMYSFSKRHTKKLETLDIDTSDALKALKDDDINWLIFCGTFGCGKTQFVTHTVYHYLIEVLCSYRQTMIPARTAFIRDKVHFITLDAYLDLIKKSYKNAEDKEEVEFINNVSLLVIDEVRAERAFSLDEIKNIELIISNRYDNELKTVLITNGVDFSFLPDMVRSRLREGYYIKAFDGGDLRGKK